MPSLSYVNGVGNVWLEILSDLDFCLAETNLPICDINQLVGFSVMHVSAEGIFRVNYENVF